MAPTVREVESEPLKVYRMRSPAFEVRIIFDPGSRRSSFSHRPGTTHAFSGHRAVVVNARMTKSLTFISDLLSQQGLFLGCLVEDFWTLNDRIRCHAHSSSDPGTQEQ